MNRAVRRVRSHGVVAVVLLILAGCGQKGPLMLPGDADSTRGAPAGGGEGTGEPGQDEDEERRDGRRDGR